MLIENDNDDKYLTRWKEQSNREYVARDTELKIETVIDT